MSRIDGSIRHPNAPPGLDLGALVASGAVSALLLSIEGSATGRIVRAGIVLTLTAAAFGIWRRGNRAGAGLAIVVGAVGLAAGIGVAGRRLAAGGFDPVALVGLLALVLGLLVLIRGFAGLLSGLDSRWVKTVVLIPSVIGAIIFIWSLALAVLATHVPETSVDRLPADVGLTAEDVRFETDDGVTLAGWYVPSTTGDAVVLRHGAGSTGSDVLDHAAVLVGQGFGVLVTDARGHGRSGGRAMDLGWNGTTDIEAAVDFLVSRSDVGRERIAVVGLSMGGEEAIGAIAADPRIRAVVAEGATGRTFEDLTWLSEIYGIRGAIQRGIDWLQYTLTDLLSDPGRPVPLAEAAEAAAPRPILLITAGEVPDEGHAARHIEARAPGSVRVWTVPGAGHTGGLSTAPEEWESRVVDFLRSVLEE